MRPLLVLAAIMLAAGVAGCLGGDSQPDANDEEIDSASAAETNATEPQPTVLAEQTHEGIAPDPEREPVMGPFSHAYELALPAEATEVRVWHNATYTGNWPAVVHLVDASGQARQNSVESCDAIDGPVPPGRAGVQQDWSCELYEETTRGTLEGMDWRLRLDWQAGEVYEEYTLDVVVWGYPDAAVTRPAS